MNPVLIVDGMIRAYALNSSLGWMSTRAGIPTGLKFGFLRTLMSYEKQFNASEIIIAWDMPGTVKKAEGTPEYKANRSYTNSERAMFEQIPGLQKFLKKTKWAQTWLPGYEADDLIAALVHSDYLKGNGFVIISSDTDLQQLLTEDAIRIWTGGKSKKTITRFDIIREWGILPEQMPLYRALIGDPSDNLEPLMAKEHHESFRLLLKDNPKIQTTTDVKEFPGLGIPENAWYCELQKREMLMRPLIPDSLPIYAGERDAEYLRREFDEMESKSLHGQLNKIV